MNKKLLLKSIGNDSYRYRYIIQKRKDFGKLLQQLLLDFQIDLEHDELDDLLFEPPISNKPRKKIDYKKVKDKYFNFHNKDFDLDIFVGDKEMVIIVRTEKHGKLVKTIDKYIKFRGEK